MNDFLEQFKHNYMPHGMCWDWDPALILTMLAGDIGTGMAYMAFTLFALSALFTKPEREHPEWGITIWMTAFIFSCGMGHFVKALNIWANYYYLEAIWGNVTAIISWICIALIVHSKKELSRKYTLTEKLNRMSMDKTVLEKEIKLLREKLDLLE